MPDSPSKKRWDAENSVTFSIKFMNKGDADIMEYLSQQAAQGVSKGAIIKQALREYISAQTNTTITTPAKGEKGQGEK